MITIYLNLGIDAQKPKGDKQPGQQQHGRTNHDNANESIDMSIDPYN